MVIKYVVRGYEVHITCYMVHLTLYVSCGYMLHVKQYVVHVMWDEVRVIWVHVTQYEVCVTWVRSMLYAVRGTWVSLYDFPPLVAFKGLFSFRKWFCFLDLKIKNGWSFHFRYSKFQGKGNKGKYLRGSDFLGYVYKVLSCPGCAVGLAVRLGWWVG